MNDKYLPMDTEGDSEFDPPSEQTKYDARAIFPADVGWELVTVEFGAGVDNPLVARDPIIAWTVTDNFVFPVMPWAVLARPIDLDEEYTAYICPDGIVVGGIHMRRFDDLQSYVEACKEAERTCRELSEEHDREPCEYLVAPPI